MPLPSAFLSNFSENQKHHYHHQQQCHPNGAAATSDAVVVASNATTITNNNNTTISEIFYSMTNSYEVLEFFGRGTFGQVV